MLHAYAYFFNFVCPCPPPSEISFIKRTFLEGLTALVLGLLFKIEFFVNLTSFLVQDLSGRPHLSYDLCIPTDRIGTYDTQVPN